MCCEGQGHGHGESRISGHLHNDVTETVPGSSNDVISTVNSDAIANSNG